MNDKNLYLTEKACRGKGRSIAGLAGLALLIYASLKVSLDYWLEKDYGMVATGLIFTALEIWPVVRIFRHWVYQRRARSLAEAFMQVMEERVSFDRLSRMTDCAVDRKRLAALVKRNYLQNIRVDALNQDVIFTVVNRYVQEEACGQMVCPHCGATNRVWQGRINRCAYCESELIVR